MCIRDRSRPPAAHVSSHSLAHNSFQSEIQKFSGLHGALRPVSYTHLNRLLTGSPSKEETTAEEEVLRRAAEGAEKASAGREKGCLLYTSRQRYERLYTGTFYRRFVLGEWAAAPGLVYDLSLIHI